MLCVDSSLSLAAEMQSELIEFITCSTIVDKHGYVYSWINPSHPGFIYPEAMGLYLKLVSQLACSSSDRRLTNRVHTVAKMLQDLIPQSGGIGKNGNNYLFDTCMAVSGLLAYKQHLNGWVDPAVLARMARFIVKMTQRKLMLLTEDGSFPEVAPHWSTVFGASMLKTAIALDALAVETNEEYYRQIALEVADQVVRECFSDNAFHVFPGATTVYCHAHCYALEGLLYLHARRYRDTTAISSAGADRLQSWQNADGSLFNWYSTSLRERWKMGDATAQAIRIWLAVDRDFYLPSIKRGVAFLASLRSPKLGLYYCAGSQDVNSWASLFAIQAMDWYLVGVKADQIV